MKNKAQERISTLKEAFETQDNGAAEMDLTRTAYPIELGTRHPLSIVKNEIIDIFHRLGFSIADGPEIEDDWHVFSSMNFAEDHPARDMQDTFFVEANPEHVQGNVILRTHTSSVQSRVMESTQPPIRIICPGRVYRNEAISYRAHAFFHQVEALYIDKNVSFTDLKQVLLLFAKEGGQGVLSMGKILAYSGLMEGKEVTWMPAYGPEQRGGTANVTVIVSDEKISSPILSKYDAAIILNQPSLEKFESKVKPGGVLIYDGYGIINSPTR